MDIKEIVARYGEPIFDIHLTEYSKEEKLTRDIPDRVCVFSTPRTPERIIVYGKVRGGKWLPHYGHKQLVKRLLTLNKII